MPELRHPPAQSPARSAVGGAKGLPSLLLSIDQGIATITINRPNCGNALDLPIFAQLRDAWSQLEQDPHVRCIILTAAGDRHFCTGADVGTLPIGDGIAQSSAYDFANHFSPRACGVTKPVLCVVNGLVNAAGLTLIADCDIILATSRAAFMDSHVSVGLVSGLEQIAIARRGGIGASLLMALTGSAYRMSAKRAYQLGIVDILEPTKSRAMQRATALARAICANSPQAVKRTKEAIWTSTNIPEPQATQSAWAVIQSHRHHPDVIEGPKAFIEKRQPRWAVEVNATPDNKADCKG